MWCLGALWIYIKYSMKYHGAYGQYTRAVVAIIEFISPDKTPQQQGL